MIETDIFNCFNRKRPVLSSLVTAVGLYHRYKVASSSRLRSSGMTCHIIGRIYTQRFGWIYCFHVPVGRSRVRPQTLIPIYQTAWRHTPEYCHHHKNTVSTCNENVRCRCGIGRTSRTWDRHGAMFFRTCQTSCSTGSRRPGCGVQSAPVIEAKPDTDSRWKRCLGVADVWEKLRAESYVSPHTNLYSYNKIPIFFNCYMFLS